MERDRIAVKISPVNPKNFLFDPNGTSVNDCMGVAIEKYVSIHKIVQGIEKGIYRKVDITTSGEDTDLEPTQEVSQYQDEKVLLLTYQELIYHIPTHQLGQVFPLDSTRAKHRPQPLKFGQGQKMRSRGST